MTKRRGLPPWVRAEVLRRDRGRCVECRTQERLSVDHIWPVSKGGSDDLANLQTLCLPCNIRKSAKVPAETPPKPVAGDWIIETESDWFWHHYEMSRRADAAMAGVEYVA